MAERLSLELELLDKVGGPAKRAAAALRGIETQQKKTQDVLNKFADSWRRIGSTAAGARDKEAAALRKMGLAQLEAIKMNKKYNDELEKAKHSHHGFLSSLKSGLKEHLGLEGLGGKLAKASFWGHLGASAVVGIGEGFIEGAHKAVEIVYDGLKEAFGAIAKEQERQAGYDLTLGSKKNAEGKTAGDEAREAIEKWSSKTAFSASQNQDQMLALFRAGLTGKSATTAYATSLDLAARQGRGSSPEAVNDAVALFAKIQNKGGVSVKELSKLGLGQENVPAFLDDIAKSLHLQNKAAKTEGGKGKTAREQAQELLSKPGSVDTQLIMNTITDAVNRAQGGSAGTGAERAGKSLAGQWNKIKSLPEEFFNKLVDSPALPKLSKALASILEQLDPNGPTGKRIMAGLNKAFDTIAGWIATALKPENVDKFFNFISEIPGYLNDALKVAEVLVEIFVGKKLVDGITSAITAMGGAAAPLLAAASAALALIEAYRRISKTAEELGGWKAVGNDFKTFVKTGGMGEAPAFAGGKANADLSAAAEAENQRNVSRARARAIQQSLDMVNHVTIVAAPGDDPTHTHQKAGQQIGVEASKVLERAVAEAGAQ